MAKLIPNDREGLEFHGSYGEKELYELFGALPDEYIIFHSAEWNKKKKTTVRFGEADFAIYHPSYGVICLEVKHGGIESSEGRIFQRNTRTKKIVGEINPMSQAQRSSFRFLELINKGIYNEDEKVKVYPAVWFTMVDKEDIKGDLPPNYVSGNTFFRRDMENIDKTLLRCFKHHNVKKRIPSKRRNKTVMNTLAPKFHAFPSMSTMFEQNEFAFNQMTKEQSYLLDYLEEQKEAAIQGGAGTGKTMMALEKARRLSEEEKVVFLCFNSLLIETMKKTYGEEMPNVTFTNLDALTYKAYRRFPTEEEKLEFLRGFENYPSIWSFSSIVIDEGQDFTDEQIRLLKEIALLNEGSFYVFYDRNQLVQQRSELKWLNDMDCQLILSFNCRNTKEIAATSSSSIYVDDVKVRYEVSTSQKPTYHNAVNKLGLIEWLTKRINLFIDEKIPVNEIVILTTKTMDKTILKNVDEIAGKKLSDKHQEDAILFTTSRKFKGLEASVIILIDVDLETFSNIEQRRVFYVGASRAKNSLDIVATIPKENEKEFYKLVSSGEKQRISAVMEYLKAKPI